MIPLWLSSLLGLLLVCAGVGVLWLAAPPRRPFGQIRVIPDRPRCGWCSNDADGDEELTYQDCSCTEACAYRPWCRAGRETGEQR